MCWKTLPNSGAQSMMGNHLTNSIDPQADNADFFVESISLYEVMQNDVVIPRLLLGALLFPCSNTCPVARKQFFSQIYVA